MAFEPGELLTARIHALDIAERFVARRGLRESQRATVTATADYFLAYLLSRTAKLMVVVSPNTFQVGDPGKFNPTKYIENGGIMAVAIGDNQYVTLSVDPTDVEGHPTSDAGLTWTADDSGATVTLVPSADGTQVNVVAVGALGTANVTGTDANGVTTPPEAITVIASGATTLGVTAGDPVDIPAGGAPVPDGVGGAAPAAPAAPTA